MQYLYTTTVSPRELRPHPLNTTIYGTDDSIDDILSTCSNPPKIEGIIVSKRTGELTIVSGHRRTRAAIALGMESIEIEVRYYTTELEELLDLIKFNRTRTITVQMKARVGRLLKAAVKRDALLRQKTGKKIDIDLLENFPGGQEEASEFSIDPNQYLHSYLTSGDSHTFNAQVGNSRDIIAALVGFNSGKNCEKAIAVDEVIEELEVAGDREAAEFLQKTLNKSVDGALQIVRQPVNRRTQVMQRLREGKARSAKAAIKQVATEEIIATQFRVGQLCRVFQEDCEQYGCVGVITEAPDNQERVCITLDNGESLCTCISNLQLIPHDPTSKHSCWTCVHRLENIDNMHFYCQVKGSLSLMDESGDDRGASCEKWAVVLKTPKSTRVELPTISVPGELMPSLQQLADLSGTSVAEYVQYWLEKHIQSCTNNESASRNLIA